LHVYRQRGPIPDRRPWPDGDPPIATFCDAADAELAVRAVAALNPERLRDALTEVFGETGADPRLDVEGVAGRLGEILSGGIDP
jgi:hypothetical protein